MTANHPQHHPSAELLYAAAAGALTPAVNRIVAAHGALCAHCGAVMAKLETLGGAELEEQTSSGLAADALDKALAAIAATPAPQTPALPAGLLAMPETIREAIAPAFDKGTWRTAMPGFKVFDLALPAASSGETFQLFRIEPGSGPPRHTHDGQEFTLVLTGAFKDETGRYGPGDIEFGHPELTHRPVAEPGEICFALAVTTAPLKFKGPLGLLQRVLNFGKPQA